MIMTALSIDVKAIFCYTKTGDTIIPSETSIISSKLSTPSLFSTLDINLIFELRL